MIDPVVAAIRAAGVEAEVFAESGIEPSEASVQVAVEAAREGGFDGFVGLGGGSSIDTAKVAALLATHPGGIYDYLNPPIGKGTPIPGPLLPLFGVPTTGGTGAEATTVAIIDLPEHHVKTGISHAYMRPLLGIVDPDLTLTTPRAVTASVGLDVLCHAIESYTAIAYDARPRSATPDGRPPYQGANPLSDVWSEQAIRLAGGGLRRAMADGSTPARAGTWRSQPRPPASASATPACTSRTPARIPSRGCKHEWKPPGYPGEDRFVPHGIAVVMTAPASFRFTEPAAPERHRARGRAARRASRSRRTITTPCARGFEELMRAVGAPAGLREIGYGEADVPDLVAGAVKQQRLLVCAPCPVTDSDLDAILRASL